MSVPLFHYLVIAGDAHGVAPAIGSVVSLLLLPRLANVARGIAQLSSLISMLRAVMAQMTWFLIIMAAVLVESRSLSSRTLIENPHRPSLTDHPHKSPSLITLTDHPLPSRPHPHSPLHGPPEQPRPHNDARNSRARVRVL